MNLTVNKVRKECYLAPNGDEIALQGAGLWPSAVKGEEKAPFDGTGLKVRVGRPELEEPDGIID